MDSPVVGGRGRPGHGEQQSLHGNTGVFFIDGFSLINESIKIDYDKMAPTAFLLQRQYIKARF